MPQTNRIFKKPTARAFLAFIVLSVGLTLDSEGQVFSISPTNIDVAAAPGYAPAPIWVPTTPATGFSTADTTVTSDASWALPFVDNAASKVGITFTALSAGTYTSTITVKRGATTVVLYVRNTVSPLNAVKLLDDPFRSKTYGLHSPSSGQGSVVLYNPLNGTAGVSITVGKNPSDFAESADGTELLVLNNGDASISVIDLNTLVVKETFPVPFATYDTSPAMADLELCSNGIIYYSDASWGPVLRVLNRSTKQVLQTIDIRGNVIAGTPVYNGDEGFGGFRLTHDGRFLFGWAQYGWSAGWGGSYISKFSVGTDGRLTLVSQTNDVYPTFIERDPLDTPVLIPWNDDRIFVKQYAVNPASISSIVASFPTPVYSISPGGEVAATSTGIYNTLTGTKKMSLPVTTSVQAITSDYARLVYFDSTAMSLNSLDLAPLAQDLNRNLQPADGSITLAPTALEWAATPGIDQYDVYLGTSRSDVAGAALNSSEYLGTVNGTSLALQRSFVAGQTYYWRVDTVTSLGTSIGAVHSFTVSTLSSSVTALNAATVHGHSSYRSAISVSGPAGSTWSASADVEWVTFPVDRGRTPASVVANLDASQLAAGVHSATITISNASGPAFTIPVTLRVEPLALTILKSDPASSRVYGISENSPSDPSAHAYLVEIDSQTEKITRVVDAGTSATDLALHHGDNTIYVPNWQPGSLLAFDLGTFQQRRAYSFNPFGGTGYGEGDVYRVSAGATGRIVVEEEDQWIDVSLFNTTTGTSLGKTFEREGGGGFDPTGRYYYHGDNNSSGAEIHKFDVTGDVFTELAHVRVESVSYYGSRTIVVSGDGTRIFWNGSMFDSALSEQWKIADEVFSASADGTYALSATKIYDTRQKKQILSMPLSTKVSTVNDATNKIVVQVDDQPAFFSLTAPLATPTLVAGTVTSDSVALSWNDQSLETGFTVQYRKVGDTAWIDAPPQPSANVTTKTVSSLASGTSYEFRVKADGGTASSDWSTIVTAATPVLPLTAPTLTTRVSTGTVLLSWTRTANATDYAIQRKISGAIEWTTLALAITPPSGNVSGSATDATVVAGTTYQYRVHASNSSQSVDSNTSTISVPAIPLPTRPRDFQSWRNTGPILLTWEDSQNETGYLLYRRLQGATEWSLIYQPNANVVKFIDLTALASRAYEYQLIAIRNNTQSEPATTSIGAMLPPDPTPTPEPTPAPQPPAPTPPPSPTPAPDTRKPTLTVLGPRSRTTIRPTIMLFGYADDNRKLERVEYASGNSGDFQNAAGKSRWTATIRLKSGRNEIVFRACDSSGNYSDSKRVVITRRD